MVSQCVKNFQSIALKPKDALCSYLMNMSLLLHVFIYFPYYYIISLSLRAILLFIMNVHEPLMVFILLRKMSIPTTIYHFWMELPKYTVLIKVLQTGKYRLYSVLFSPDYSPISFPLKNDCNKKLIICSQLPVPERRKINAKYGILTNCPPPVFHTQVYFGLII